MEGGSFPVCLPAFTLAGKTTCPVAATSFAGMRTTMVRYQKQTENQQLLKNVPWQIGTAETFSCLD